MPGGFGASLKVKAAAALRYEPIEQGLLWFYIAGLAWVPFWYGSNDWIAWGINAMIFPGLALLYEISLLLRSKSHPLGIVHIAMPAVLFALVLIWTELQCIAWVNFPLANPIWTMAGSALGHPVAGSISVNRDLTTVALMRLITAASAFWVALQLSRDPRRAAALMNALGAICAGYAIYGLIAMKTGQLPWLHYIDDIDGKAGRLSSTFIDPDSYATYDGIGLVVMAGLTLQHYSHAMREAAGNWRLQIAYFIERTGGRGAAFVVGGFVILVALLLSGSRGGVLATAFGLIVLGGVARLREGRTKAPIGLLAVGLAGIAVTLFVFGQAIGVKFAEGGISDESRIAVYRLTLRSILNEPLLGYGYGTFSDVFPMYRDRSISVLGVWSQAHNTYLEVFQGLGLIFGTMLIVCVAVIIVRCLAGAMTRHHDDILPAIAGSAGCLVALHALVDFSLQMQAVALTLMAVLGAGAAQSYSSRTSLED